MPPAANALRSALSQSHVFLGPRAEGAPPLQSVIGSGQRMAREYGAPADAYTGLPIATGTASDRAYNQFQQQYLRALLGDAASIGPEALVGTYNAVAPGDPYNALADYGGAGLGVSEGAPGSPVANALASRARPTLGFSAQDRDIMEGLAYSQIPGIGTVAGALSLADYAFGPIPGVVGGEIAPRPGTQGFRDQVGAGRAARSMRSLADRGNRSIGGTGL